MSKISPSFFPPARAAQYGDGLFETIRVFNGRLPFWKYHWQRLAQGFRVLKFDVPEYYSSLFFQNEILKLIEGKGNHRIRLTVWRNSDGLYTPQKNEPIFNIENSTLPSDFFELNNEGLNVGIYVENNLPLAKKATDERCFLPNIKTCNSLPFILANIFRKENNYDDILILNPAGRVACGGSSNIFLWNKNELITPPLSEGCVAGTMRKVVMDICKKKEISILEKRVAKKDLKNTEGIFLTNAISGIKWVGKINDEHIIPPNKKTGAILNELNLHLL